MLNNNGMAFIHHYSSLLFIIIHYSSLFSLIHHYKSLYILYLLNPLNLGSAKQTPRPAVLG